MVEDFGLLVNVEGSFPCTKWTRNITDRTWVCPWPWLIQWIILQKRLSWTSISFYAGPSWFTLICCMLVDQDCHAIHQQQKLWSTSLVCMIFNSLTKGGFLVKKQCLSIQVFGLFLNLQCNKQPNLVMFNIIICICCLCWSVYNMCITCVALFWFLFPVAVLWMFSRSEKGCHCVLWSTLGLLSFPECFLVCSRTWWW